MNKIYIITKGEYSDYQIVCVFSTEEKAMAYIDEYMKTGLAGYGDEMIIEEFKVDDTVHAEMVTKKQYEAKIRLRDGELQDEKGQLIFVRPNERGCSYFGIDYGVGISYISQEHARKLAVEARQDWLRQSRRER